MRIVSIHQPSYFPWLGLLDKIARSDVFIVLDTVQYNKRAFQHRTLYSTVSGSRYLSVPVKNKGHQTSGLAIQDVVVADPAIFAAHFETLRHRYGRAAGWPQWAPLIGRLAERQPLRLLDANLWTLEMTLKAFGLAPEIVRASKLGAEGHKTALMLNLTQAVGGDIYLSGAGASDYMDDALFCESGIEVIYQQFHHPEYPQSHGMPFQPGCFALEWAIEAPDRAAIDFRRLIKTSGPVGLRCGH